ncbi:MAG: AMP-binding protein [Kiritimatiellia bacterium]
MDKKEEYRSLADIVQEHAASNADAAAFIFLADGLNDRQTWTRAELHRRSCAIAKELAGRSARGQTALLLYYPGLEFIAALFGCLYSGVIAIPAYPPGISARSSSRIESIVKDAGASLVLTTSKIKETRRKTMDKQTDLKHLGWIETDRIVTDTGDGFTPIRVSANDVAYLQYTSGSTSTPKGVIVTHGNLVHNMSCIDFIFSMSKGSGVVSWMPHFHDFGLVYGILTPLFTGKTCTLLPPAIFVQNPYVWLKAVSDSRASHTAAPNFAYDLCNTRIDDEQRKTLDLSCLRAALNGAEPVRPSTLKLFQERFGPCGLNPNAQCPSYGLAEGTLAAVCASPDEPPVCLPFDAEALEQHRVIPADKDSAGSRMLAACGKTVFGMKTEIADPATLTRAPKGGVGEIWLSSPSVCAGYWKRPEETREIFQARLADTGGGPFLRTGDLGFIHNDYLYITGRIKDLIIIHGVNYYPQDIELTCENAHPALKANSGAAFSIERDGAEKLIVVYEQDRTVKDPDINQIAMTIRHAVAEEHELQIYDFVLVRPGTISKTSSGKIQRHACKQDYLQGGLKIIADSRLEIEAAGERKIEAPADDLEQKLVKIWEEVLEISPVGVTDNYFDLGGNSLHALRIIGKIGEITSREIQLADLFQTPTIRGVAELLRQTEESHELISLVPMQTAGKCTPFFCVHPGGGTVMCFNDLAHSIGKDQPLYALQSQGVDGKHPPLKRVEDMAALYIREIRTIQPAGPYRLGGMCLGGVIAYEMAQQLVKQGEKVEFLGVLDTRRPPGWHRPLFHQRRVIKEWLSMISNAGQKRALKRVWLTNEKARNRYRPDPYPGKITIFWSEHEGDPQVDRQEIWRKLALGGLEKIDIEGSSHCAILSPPHVHTLAAKILKCLEPLNRPVS